MPRPMFHPALAGALALAALAAAPAPVAAESLAPQLQAAFGLARSRTGEAVGTLTGAVRAVALSALRPGQVSADASPLPRLHAAAAGTLLRVPGLLPAGR